MYLAEPVQPESDSKACQTRVLSKQPEPDPSFNPEFKKLTLGWTWIEHIGFEVRLGWDLFIRLGWDY